MRSISNVLTSLAHEEKNLLEAIGKYPRATRNYYINHRRLTHIRQHKYLLTAPIAEIESKRDNAHEKWLVKCNDKENDPWGKSEVALTSLAASILMNFLLVESTPLLSIVAMGSFYFPIKSTATILYRRAEIKEQSELLTALNTLLECRNRNEAPDDKILNKLNNI